MVDHIDLDQQAEDIVDIMFDSSSDMHVSKPFYKTIITSEAKLKRILHMEVYIILSVSGKINIMM